MCYYCGECSEQCPKEAEPGETMMSMRRWLTAKYDFSGLSGLFYRSPAWEIIAIVIAAILTGIGFVAFGILNGGSFSVYDGENAFLPAHYVHRFDWAMAIVLVAAARHQRAAHVAERDEGVGRRASARTSRPCHSCRISSSRRPSTSSASASARGRSISRSC